MCIYTRILATYRNVTFRLNIYIIIIICKFVPCIHGRWITLHLYIVNTYTVYDHEKTAVN